MDCLFEHTRKLHDSAKTRLTLSGLLNCMDGLLRGGSDGLIMILTANMTSEINEAMLRTASVDLSAGSRWALRTRIVSRRARASCFTWRSSDGSILKRSRRRFGRGLHASSSRRRCSSSTVDFSVKCKIWECARCCGNLHHTLCGERKQEMRYGTTDGHRCFLAKKLFSCKITMAVNLRTSPPLPRQREDVNVHRRS